MRVEKTFYAFDDKEFYSEEECLAYEQEMKESMKAAVFYDDERNTVDVEKDGTGNAYFIRIVNAEQAPSLFDWLCYQFGFEFPEDNDYEDGDLFVYGCDRGDWVNLNEQLRWVQGMLAMFETKEGESDAAEGCIQTT